MLLVESATDLLLWVVVALVLALEFDPPARLVRPLRLLGLLVGRLQGSLVADPVLWIIHVATELVLVVIDLLGAASRLILVRVLAHVPLPRRAAAPSSSLGPLLGMSVRTLSAVLPGALARLAGLR